MWKPSHSSSSSWWWWSLLRMIVSTLAGDCSIYFNKWINCNVRGAQRSPNSNYENGIRANARGIGRANENKKQSERQILLYLNLQRAKNTGPKATIPLARFFTMKVKGITKFYSIKIANCAQLGSFQRMPSTRTCTSFALWRGVQRFFRSNNSRSVQQSLRTKKWE